MRKILFIGNRNFKASSLSNNLFKLFSTQVIRDKDSLSQQQIDDILGNPYQQKPKVTPIKIQESIPTTTTQQFYQLVPIKNQPFPPCLDPDAISIEQTPNQNIFAALNLPVNCSYQDYTQALTNFRTQTDLYGDEQQKSVIDPNSLQFRQILDFNSKFMELSRKRHMINMSIPGTIQSIDPRKFMELRPIQQFRHTPQYPISDSMLKRHQQMLQNYHRRQFVFQVSKQNVINWFLVFVAMCIGGYFIKILLEKEQQRSVAYVRLKNQRITGQQGDSGFRI